MQTFAFIALYYVLFTLMSFWFQYELGLEANGRIPWLDLGPEDEKWWQMIARREKKIWKFFVHDYFEIYCPWSWQRAVHFRVLDVREILKTHTHEKGWTIEDTFRPELREQIARTCFKSRKDFWKPHLLFAITGPIWLVVQIVISLVLSPFIIVMDIWSWLQDGWDRVRGRNV